MFPANPFLQVQKKLSSVYKPGFDICGEVRGEKTGQWTVLLFTIRNNVGKLKKLEGKCSENMLQRMNSSGVQASMLIQMHSLIFGRLLHVWLFWNQSVYIYIDSMDLSRFQNAGQGCGMCQEQSAWRYLPAGMPAVQRWNYAMDSAARVVASTVSAKKRVASKVEMIIVSWSVHNPTLTREP